MRRLIYKEDDQGYGWTAIIFETDCRLSVNLLSEFSWFVRGAGRFSTTFETFMKIMKDVGYIVKEIERLPCKTLPKDNKLEIVKGATGNY